MGACLYPGYITGIEILAGQASLVRWSLQTAPGRAAAGRVMREVMAPPWPRLSNHPGTWSTPAALN